MRSFLIVLGALTLFANCLFAIPGEVNVKKKKNVFLLQTDLYNVITWEKPATIIPVLYFVYRDAALTDLAGTVSAHHSLKFKDFNRKKDTLYHYYIVGQVQDGSTYLIGSVSVKD